MNRIDRLIKRSELCELLGISSRTYYNKRAKLIAAGLVEIGDGPQKKYSKANVAELIERIKSGDVSL